MNLLSQEIPEFFKNLPARRVGYGIFVSAPTESRQKKRETAAVVPPPPRITEKQFASIHRYRKNGYTQMQIAKKMKLEKYQVAYALRVQSLRKVSIGICTVCGIEKKVSPSGLATFKFCSWKCRYGEKDD